MAKLRRNEGHTWTARRLNPSSVASGLIWAFLLTLVLSAVMAALIFTTSISETTLSRFLEGGGLFSLFVGSAYAARRAGSLGWMHGGMVGALYILLSSLLGALFSPVQITLAMVGKRLALGAVLGAIGGTVGVNL